MDFTAYALMGLCTHHNIWVLEVIFNLPNICPQRAIVVPYNHAYSLIDHTPSGSLLYNNAHIVPVDKSFSFPFLQEALVTCFLKTALDIRLSIVTLSKERNHMDKHEPYNQNFRTVEHIKPKSVFSQHSVPY